MAGDLNYFGRNLPQWRQHNREVENQINSLARSGQWGLVENILEDEGYKFDEFEKQLYALEQAVDRGKRDVCVRYVRCIAGSSRRTGISRILKAMDLAMRNP